ncbi:MAG: hypothetical protein DCE90_02720, partial [Pseudanabaena sp.]
AISILLCISTQCLIEMLPTYFPIKFYKERSFNTNYNDDVRRYEHWLKRCDSTIYDATKAANWFADVVREYVNPMFFVEKGKFIIEQGSLELLEFTEEEKSEYPDKILRTEDNDFMSCV